LLKRVFLPDSQPQANGLAATVKPPAPPQTQAAIAHRGQLRWKSSILHHPPVH